MAFTESSLQAQLDADGAGCKITMYNAGDAYTDVYVQNVNSTSRKSGVTQIDNSRTAAQAASDIRANLTT